MQDYFIMILYDKCEDYCRWLINEVGKSKMDAIVISRRQFKKELDYFLNQPEEDQLKMLRAALVNLRKDFENFAPEQKNK